MFTVGQKLWFVPSQRYLGEPKEVSITKIGRKWLSVSNGMKISIDNLNADGGQYISPGTAYLNRGLYESDLRLNGLWKRLKLIVNAYAVPPDCMNEQKIQDILALLEFKEGA